MSDSQAQVLAVFSLLDTLQKQAQAAMPECNHGTLIAQVSLRFDGANFLNNVVWISAQATHLPSHKVFQCQRIVSQIEIEQGRIDLVQHGFDMALADLVKGIEEAGL